MLPHLEAFASRRLLAVRERFTPLIRHQAPMHSIETDAQIIAGDHVVKKTPLLISAVTGEGMPDALRALVEVIGEAPVSLKAKGGAAQAEPWTPATQG
jgi:hypothetical protein